MRGGYKKRADKKEMCLLRYDFPNGGGGGGAKCVYGLVYQDNQEI